MTPPVYKNFEEKSVNFGLNQNIENKDELDKLIKMYSSKDDFLYRGINNASYKLYSSSQVQLYLADAINKINKDDYVSLIKKYIALTRNNDCVKRYIEGHNLHDDDMFILALMQHYEIPSPMLDFTHSILGALYFAWDKHDSNLSKEKNNLSNYVSIYVINRNNAWVKCSVQTIMNRGEKPLNSMLSGDELFRVGRVNTASVENEYKKYPYESFKDLSFIPVDDNPDFPIRVNIPILGLQCDHQIVNDRIISQQGMFIMNNTIDKPLVEVMNDVITDKPFRCYNIHKNLLDYIKTEYLDKNEINKDTVYCKNNQESVELETELGQIRQNVIDELKKHKY